MSRYTKRKWTAVTAAAVMLALAIGCGARRPARTSAASRTTGMPSPYAASQTFAPAPTIVLPPAQTPVQSIYSQQEQNFAIAGIAGKSVIIDAGHGGHDEGTSHFGLREKDISLDLAMRTAALLRARGVNVIMTRSADQFIPLPERSAVANRSPNAALVSIHVNAAPSNPQAAGVETFVLSQEFTDQERGKLVAERYRMNGQDTAQGRQALANLAQASRSRGPALASALQRSLCSRLGETDRGVKTKNLAVLRETYFGPAALVEVGFLTNANSARRMSTEDWRRRTAEALADGIGSFLSQM